MGPSTVHDQRGDVRYHRRYLKPTPFVMAAFTTLGFGAAMVILHSGIVTMLGLIAIFTLLTGCYLEGPAKSVTVRNDTLEVRNSFFRYVIPPARILAIDHVEDFGVRVRVEGDDVIRVGAFSRSQLRFRRLSEAELQANAGSLTDALFATPAPADHREVERRYRWGNVLLAAAALTALLIPSVVMHKS
jgi:hypothetical protein